MSILSLKETTSSFFEDLSDLTTDIFAGNGPPYPEFTPLTPKLERGKAFKVFPYAFRVGSTDPAGNLPFIGSGFTGLGQGGGPDAPFRKLKLNVNPQSINLDETYAINVTPTEGGVVREHKGLILRDLTITGTTGVNPNRGTQGLTEGVETGYEAMHKLINYFRSYAEKMKTDPDFRRKNILIFVNRKDSEELVVEPIRISRKKAIPKSTIYEYTLVFKVIGAYQQSLPFPPWLSGILDTLQDIGNAIDDIYFRLQAAKGILVTSENFLKNVNADIVNTILEPLKQVSSFLQAFGNFKQTLLDLPSNIYKDIKSQGGAQLQQLKNGGNPTSNPSATKYKSTDTQKKKDKDKVTLAPDDNLGSFLTDNNISVSGAMSSPVEQFLTPAQQAAMLQLIADNSTIQKDFIDNLIANINSLSNQVAQQAGLSDDDFSAFTEEVIVETPTSTTAVATNQQIDVLNALQEVATTLTYLSSAPQLFAEDPSAKAQQAENAFGGNIAVSQGASVKTITVDQGQTIVDLAAKYLGDALKWPDIVQANNLKPPFIVDDIDSTLKNVMKPGDSILIPLPTTSSVPQNDVLERRPINANLNALERNLGIDLMLNNANDLAVANNDFKLIAGVKNALQALGLKFRVTPGELRYHPGYGFPLEIGVKTTDLTATDVFDATTSTILSDDRFSDIKNLQINFNNGIITVITKVVPKGGSLPVPLVLRF